MKKMRQVLSLVLVLIMLLNIMQTPGSNAEESTEPKATVETTEEKGGDGVTGDVKETVDMEKSAENNEVGKAESDEIVVADEKLPLGKSVFFHVPDGKDITAKVIKSRPDVYRVDDQNKKEYFIKDGVLQDKRPEIRPGHKVEFYYKWEIVAEQMPDVQAGDWFTIKLPKVEKLELFGFDTAKPAPIESKDDPEKTLGEFTVDTINGIAKLKLNDFAANKHVIEDGFLKLRFEAKQSFDFTIDEHSADIEAITVIPQDTPDSGLAGQYLYNPTQPMYKHGQTVEVTIGGKKENRIFWNVYANYDSLYNQLTDGDVVNKDNVWVEDDLNGSGLKIDESYVRYATGIYVAQRKNDSSAKAEPSTYGIHWPGRYITNFIKPNDGESYEDFKTRVKAIRPSKAFVVAIYPREEGDAILFSLGDLGKDRGVSYSHIEGDDVKDYEQRVAISLQKAKRENKITDKQVQDTMKLYGIDGNPNTDMKKMVNYHLMFRTIPNKPGLYKNTAEMTWNDKRADATTSLHYSVGAAGAGYHDVTAVSVKKIWKRQQGHPVTMKLYEVTQKDSNSPEERVLKNWVKLGVTNPDPQKKEVSGLTYNFNNLRTHKRVVEGTPQNPGKVTYLPIKYDIVEEMDSTDQSEFDQHKDVQDTDFIFTNENKRKDTFKVTKKWIKTIPDNLDYVLVDIVEKETGEVVLADVKIEKPSVQSDVWEKTFEVPMFNLNNNPARYKAVEKTVVPGYVAFVEEGDKYCLCTIYNVESIAIDVTKEWKGDLATATFELWKNGNNTGKTNSITGNGIVRFENLPKYSINGEEIQYEVKEQGLDGYLSEKTGDATKGFKFTNTQKVNVEVIKKWYTDNPSSDITKIHVQLWYADDNGTPTTIVPNVGMIELDAVDNAKGLFTDLPKVDLNGKELKYTVVEANPKDNFVVSVKPTSNVSVQGTQSLTVTNTKKTNIVVTKQWVGNPSAILLQLWRGVDGSQEEKYLEVEPANQDAQTWTHRFSNLPLFDNTGKKYTYRVDEVAKFADSNHFTKHIGEMIPNNDGYGVTIINTNTQTITVNAKKVWLDDSNKLGKRPASITFVLTGKADGDDALITREMQLSTANSVAGEADVWAVTFADLPKYSPNSGKEYVYSVKEKQALNGYHSVASGSMTEGFVITNILNGKTAVAVTKEWIGEPKEEITVHLYRGGVPYVDESGVGVSKVITKAEKWQHTFTGLPQFDERGREYVYTVKEAKIDNYYTSIRQIAKNSFEIVNIEETPIEIEVIKTWHGPKREVTVELYADYVRKAGTITLNEQNNWRGKFTNLKRFSFVDGQPITYTIKEVELANYKAEITGSAEKGFTIKNTNTETIRIPVQKNWIGEVGTNPVVINLKQNGNDFRTLVLNANDGWSGTFTDLPKYDENGVEFAYYLEEVVPQGYKSEKAQNSSNDITAGVVFTNTKLTSVRVSKTWYPATATSQAVTFVLTGGIAEQSVELDGVVDAKETTPWMYVFENLPTHRPDNTPIVYDVKEIVVPSFFSHKSGNTTDGFTFTNIAKTSVKVKKQWIGAEPTEATAVVEATLYEQAEGAANKTTVLKNGAAYVITLNRNNGWSGEFVELPRTTADGKAITYTVEETAKPANYRLKDIVDNQAHDGFVITNINDTKINATATKVWKDTVDTTRPSEITFVLTGKAGNDGEADQDVVVIKKTLTVANKIADDKWQVEFTGLRKYSEKNGKLFEYSIAEEGGVVSYNTTVGGDINTGFVVTNTIFGKVTVMVTKKWLGAPTDAIVVNLFRQVGADASTKTKVDSRTIKATSDPLTNWKHTFSDLEQYNGDGKEYTYLVEEEALAGYTAKIEEKTKNSFEITNTNDKLINIPVKKTWVHSSTAEVTIRLWIGDEQVDTLKLNAANGWAGEFKDKRMYSAVDGEIIPYRITEDEVPNFRTEITGNKDTGFTVTNTYIPAIPPYTPGGEETPDPNPNPNPNPNPGPNPTPTPTPENPTPTPPTVEIPEEPTPEGTPNIPNTSHPEETIVDEPIPLGKTELPKTSGTPAAAMFVFGMGLVGLGAFFKKKKQ